MKTLQEFSSEERASLDDMRQRVASIFPGIKARMTLFGSRARGDADP
jgi:hypothetical protein